MKTVILNFTQPNNKEVIVLLAPDDMDVHAEIAECRTRSRREDFSREERSQTVMDWFLCRGCRVPDEQPIMIDGWHEPPMTRPRSENHNMPLVLPYIRLPEGGVDPSQAANTHVPDDEFCRAIERGVRRSNRPVYPQSASAGDGFTSPIDAEWVEEANRQIGVQYLSPSELTQEECATRAIRRPRPDRPQSVSISADVSGITNTFTAITSQRYPIRWDGLGNTYANWAMPDASIDVETLQRLAYGTDTSQPTTRVEDL